MSRMTPDGRIVVKPGNNIYTALAAAAVAAVITALAILLLKGNAIGFSLI
jgi:hypothetical protein